MPSALPLSPMKAMCWPCTTRLPTAMPGANAHPRAFRPSSVPGVSLLMCMYQYSHPSASRSTSMFPLFVDVSWRTKVITPSRVARSFCSFVPIRSLPCAGGRRCGGAEVVGEADRALDGEEERRAAAEMDRCGRDEAVTSAVGSSPAPAAWAPAGPPPPPRPRRPARAKGRRGVRTWADGGVDRMGGSFRGRRSGHGFPSAGSPCPLSYRVLLLLLLSSSATRKARSRLWRALRRGSHIVS